jgi:hypothetical protein
VKFTPLIEEVNTMKYKLRIYMCLIVFFAMIMAACATTEIKSVWNDASYHGGPLLKVVVMGLAKDQAVKRLYEDEFVSQLKAHGVQAFPGYSVIPQEKMGDENYILEKIKGLGVDATLVTRLVDKKTIQTYYPPEMYYAPAPHYRGWNGYYRSSYNYMVGPGYTATEEAVVLETNIYSTQNNQLIWSALSETFMEGSSESLIYSLVQKLIKDMAAKDLIP